MLIVGFCMLVAGNLVAGGFLFNYFVGMPYWLGVVIIAVLAVAYTGTGGLIADAYTAIIQMVTGPGRRGRAVDLDGGHARPRDRRGHGTARLSDR